MKATGKIGRARSAKSIAASPKTGARRASRQTGVVKTADGESTRIRVLDYLGGGKLVVDLKGQRMVARTNLFLEKNQEIDVIVRNVGDTIVLQLASDAQQNISVESSPDGKSSLGDIMRQLMTSLESAEAETPPGEPIKEILQSVRELVQRMTVDVTEKDLPQQIKDAVNAMGHDYERKLAEAYAKGRLPAEMRSHLKARLMQLRSALNEGPLRTPLLEAVEKMLENMESQQLRSLSQAEKFQHLYVQIPVAMEEQTSVAELEFFRPEAGRDQDDDNYNITLGFDLQKLGRMEFVMTVIDKHISCRIKADEYETYTLAKEHSGDLEGRLTALGYNVSGILCVIENLEGHSSGGHQSQTAMDDIDITI